MNIFDRLLDILIGVFLVAAVFYFVGAKDGGCSFRITVAPSELKIQSGDSAK